MDGEAADDWSGRSVSMPDNNTVAIGAYGMPETEAMPAMCALPVRRKHGFKGADMDGEAVDDRSGWSVSMPDNNTVAIGAYQNAGSGNFLAMCAFTAGTGAHGCKGRIWMAKQPVISRAIQ